MDGRSVFMQVCLQAEESMGWIHVDLLVQLQGVDELAWGLDHCTPHRRHRWTVSDRCFGAWQQAQRNGDVERCQALLQPAVLLWDQPHLEAISAQQLRYTNQFVDGWITRALLERLAQQCHPSDLLRDLKMLELETAGLSTAVSAPADRDAAGMSLFCIGREQQSADQPAPVLR